MVLSGAKMVLSGAKMNLSGAKMIFAQLEKIASCLAMILSTAKTLSHQQLPRNLFVFVVNNIVINSFWGVD
jgi:uncharacterized membrane protein